MLDELTIYQKTYDFILWLHPVVNEFPKSHRFILGQRIENTTIDLIRSFIIGNAEREKASTLKRASVELDELRILMRLARKSPPFDQSETVSRQRAGWPGQYLLS